MDNKRKACYLLLMLLVTNFHIGMPHTIPARVPRDIDASGTDSSPTLEDEGQGVHEVVEYIMRNSADVAQAGEIMDQLEQLLSGSADRAKSFIIDTLKTNMIESEDSVESTAAVHCFEAALPGVAQSYNNLSEAQIACERLHEACSGLTGNETVVLVEICINAQPIEAQTYYSDLYWQKYCDSLLSFTASLATRVKRAYETGSALKVSVKAVGTKFMIYVRKVVDQRYQKAAEAVQNAKSSGPGLSTHILCKRATRKAYSRITAIVKDTSAYNQAKNRYIGHMSGTQTGRDLAAAYDELYRGVPVPPLDKSEYISLWRYTKEKGHFSEVNTRLREGSFADEDVILQHLLIKTPKVGRNTKLVRFEDEWPGSEAFYKKNECTYESFLSTSKNLRLQTSNIPKSYDWERYYRIEISKPRHGVEVANLMKPTHLDKDQQEVLFPAGSTFTVKSVSDWQPDSSAILYKIIKLEE